MTLFHDCAGDDRGHEGVDPAHSREVDDQADEGEGCAGCDDATLGVVHAQGFGYGDDRRDECEGGAEVGGEAARCDEKEEEGADGAEEQGGRRGEAGEERDEEGRAEHCDDVLSADANGTGPGQSFTCGDDFAGGNSGSVAVQGPAEQSARVVAHERALRSVDGHMAVSPVGTSGYRLESCGFALSAVL